MLLASWRDTHTNHHVSDDELGQYHPAELDVDWLNPEFYLVLRTSRSSTNGIEHSISLIKCQILASLLMVFSIL